MRLFSPGGDVVTKEVEDYGFVWISDIDSDTNEGFAIGKMPLTGITIDESTDLVIVRTLGNDFALSIFGKQPINITLSGVAFIGHEGCSMLDDVDDDHGGELYESPEQLLDEFDINKDPDARLKVCIETGSSDVREFVCALTGMQTMAEASNGNPALYTTYKLSLIGVEE